MSYLLQHTRRASGIRLDENLRLNRPGLYGDAYVRTFVACTDPYGPQFALHIADCVNVITLEFSIDSPELRENSLFKLDTLIGALGRFRNAIAELN